MIKRYRLNKEEVFNMPQIELAGKTYEVDEDGFLAGAR